MKKLIGIINVSSGAMRHRSAETLTLDVPADFDRQTGGVSVDADRIVRYFAPGGSRRLYVGRPRQLSARVAGEECLVAEDAIERHGAFCLLRYTLSVVGVSD